MNTSTIEATRSPGKRLGLFALALAVACAGMFGLASSKAQAAPDNQPFTMQLDRALMNLGFAFSDQSILPAPSSLKQAPDNPLPNWWDLQESAVGAGIASGSLYGLCNSPLKADESGPNPLFPCGSNPAGAQVGAVGGAGQLLPGLPWPAGTLGPASSTWNPTTGEIELDRVLPGGASPSQTPVNWDVRFPIMSVVSPTTGDDVPLTLVATGALTGTWSNPIAPATGDGSLTLTPEDGSVLESRVLVGLGIDDEDGGPQPFTFCKVDLPGATLSTGKGSGVVKYDGTPFNFGLTGSGAFQGSWEIKENAVGVVQGRGEVEPNFTPNPANPRNPNEAAAKVALFGDGTAENPGACKDSQSAVNAAIKGPGSLWVGNRIAEPKCGENQIGTYPNCVDPKANIKKISLKGKKKVKGGKTVTVTVRVRNTGTADQNVKVRLFTTRGKVKGKQPVTVKTTAGSTGTKKVKIKTKKGKGKTVVSATNGAKTGKLTIKTRK